MTASHRPRHAAPPRPVDTPTMVLSAVIPSQRPAPEPTERPAPAPSQRPVPAPVPHPVPAQRTAAGVARHPAAPAPAPNLAAPHPATPHPATPHPATPHPATPHPATPHPAVAAYSAVLPPVPVHPANPLAYAPPAGLPVGHEPIRKRSAGPALLTAGLAFVVVTGSIVAIGNLARDASTVAGQTGTSAVSTSEQIAGWRDGGGLTRMQAIQDDLASIGDAGARTDSDAMNTACRSLQRDVGSAQAYAPVPDAQVQSSWAGALAHGARAATYCIAGTEQLDADMLNRSADELTEMGRDLDDGAARLATITS